MNNSQHHPRSAFALSHEGEQLGRRSFLAGLAGAAGATVVSAAQKETANAAPSQYADPKNRFLPDPGMRLDLRHTALVVIDPQIDFMSPKWASWSIVGESVTEQRLQAFLGARIRGGRGARCNCRSKSPRGRRLPGSVD